MNEIEKLKTDVEKLKKLVFSMVAVMHPIDRMKIEHALKQLNN